ILHQAMTVVGNKADWLSVAAIHDAGDKHLWVGAGLPAGQWRGHDDLIFSLRSGHADGKLFFLIEVQDDTLSDFNRQYAWLNDGIEIYIDAQHGGGSRITGIGAANDYQDRIGKEMRGYEMQFLPSDPVKVFVDDSKGVYY